FRFLGLVPIALFLVLGVRLREASLLLREGLPLELGFEVRTGSILRHSFSSVLRVWFCELTLLEAAVELVLVVMFLRLFLTESVIKLITVVIDLITFTTTVPIKSKMFIFTSLK